MFLTTIAFLVLGQSGPMPQTKPHAPAPVKYSCIHCGRKMSVKPADMKKKCTVCKCGQTNAACKPKGGN